jgi:hypothetical protein
LQSADHWQNPDNRDVPSFDQGVQWKSVPPFSSEAFDNF